MIVLLAAWLVVDKLAALVHPAPAVGYWKTSEGQRAYARAYDDVLAALPPVGRSTVVQTSFGSVHVLRWNGAQPGPPVLLLPGRGAGAPMWAENLPGWIGARTVYALDPLGDAGFSSQRLPLRSFEDQAEWVSQVLDALGVTQAHVVGHSFGGATAAVFALRHPHQVATLALLEPVVVVRPLPASAVFWATLTQLPVPQDLKDRALAKIGGTTLEEVRERTPMSTMIDAGISNYSAALPMPRTLTDEEWRSLRMPVRVDVAGVSSLSGGTAAVDRLRALLPHATVIRWPDATHSLPMQQRAALAPQLLDFWRDDALRTG